MGECVGECVGECGSECGSECVGESECESESGSGSGSEWGGGSRRDADSRRFGSVAADEAHERGEYAIEAVAKLAADLGQIAERRSDLETRERFA